MSTQEEKLTVCVKLIQSILNHADFVVETPNEGALVKAMEIAGYPLTPTKSLRDIEKDYIFCMGGDHSLFNEEATIEEIVGMSVFDVANQVINDFEPTEESTCCGNCSCGSGDEEGTGDDYSSSVDDSSGD